MICPVCNNPMKSEIIINNRIRYSCQTKTLHGIHAMVDFISNEIVFYNISIHQDQLVSHKELDGKACTFIAKYDFDFYKDFKKYQFFDNPNLDMNIFIKIYNKIKKLESFS